MMINILIFKKIKIKNPSLWEGFVD